MYGDANAFPPFSPSPHQRSRVGDVDLSGVRHHEHVRLGAPLPQAVELDGGVKRGKAHHRPLGA